MKLSFLVAVILCLSKSLLAQYLDNTFGNGGKVTTPFPRHARIDAMALDSNEKIVAAGISGDDVTIARYNTNGTLDPSFNGTGSVSSSQIRITHDVVIQPDGKIVVTGSGVGSNEFVILRYNVTGSPDSTFGDFGIVTTDFIDRAAPYAIALQTDCKIVVAGSFHRTGIEEEDFAIARYDTNGDLDYTFGIDGIRLTDFSVNDYARDIVITDQDQIIVGGYTKNSSYDYALACYDSLGTLIPTYGNGGKVVTNDPKISNRITKMVLQPDGKVVATGFYESKTAVAVRFKTNGELDSSFGSNGVVAKSIGRDWGWSKDIAISRTGKIIVVGVSDFDFACVQFTSTGTIDTDFGDSGSFIFDFDGVRDQAEAVLIQPDGKIVIGGFSNDGQDSVFALARIVSDNSHVTVRRDTYPEMSLNLYPNPVNTILYLTPILPEAQPIISDALGRPIPITNTQSGDALRIDVSLLETGVYWIKYGPKRSKFLKQ